MTLLQKLFTLTLTAGSLSGAGNFLNAQTGYGQIFHRVEYMPSFPGNVYEWISANLKYPEAARRKNIEGKVILSFVVNKTGQVEKVEIARSSGNDLLDNEAVRVISLMPLWKPGRDKGKTVNVAYSLPLTFALDK